MEHSNFEEIDGTLSTSEGNTLDSERYREGRVVNDLLFFRTTHEAFIHKKNAPVGFSQTATNTLNLTYCWVCYPFQEVVEHKLIVISLKFTGKSIMTTGDSLTAEERANPAPPR